MIAPLKVFFFWEGDQAYRRSHDLESPENGAKRASGCLRRCCMKDYEPSFIWDILSVSLSTVFTAVTATL